MNLPFPDLIVILLFEGTGYGGSTITQRLAKNLYGSIDRTLTGKIIEYYFH